MNPSPLHQHLELRDSTLTRRIGDGGWDTINAKHYALIGRRLDKISGLGRRVVIMFGAGHKHWFLDRLRERDDVTLLEVAPYLDQIERGE